MLDNMLCPASVISSHITFIAGFVNRCNNISFPMLGQLFLILKIMFNSCMDQLGQNKVYVLLHTFPVLHILVLLGYCCHRLKYGFSQHYICHM